MAMASAVEGRGSSPGKATASPTVVEAAARIAVGLAGQHAEDEVCVGAFRLAAGSLGFGHGHWL